MYRNKIDIISYEGILVEAQSLWRKHGELMILEDEDQFASAPYDENKFTFIND